MMDEKKQPGSLQNFDGKLKLHARAQESIHAAIIIKIGYHLLFHPEEIGV